MPNAGVFVDIWTSFCALPLWVMAFLGPISLITPSFVSDPMGFLVAALAGGGMLTNQMVVSGHRGFAMLVSGGHVLAWAPLVLRQILARPMANGAYGIYLKILLGVNRLSLLCDIIDLRLWLDGVRRVPGHERSA